MSFRSIMAASGTGGMIRSEMAPISDDQKALNRIPGLLFLIDGSGRIIVQPGTPQLKLFTQVYSNGSPARDVAKLIARRGADLLDAYMKVIAAASNGRNPLVDQNNHLAWVPALRSLAKDKRWAEYPDVKNHHVQAVMIALGEARKRFVDGHLASDPACKAQPNREPFKSFVDLLDRFNVARGIQTAPTATAAASAAPVAPAQSAPTIPSAFQISANHLQSTADQMIRDAFAALQISDQQNDQISNGLQTSADQLQAAVTKTIQDALDGFNANDKVTKTITQQNDQANKAAQLAQTEITALRAKYETAQKQCEKMKDEHDKMKEKHDKMKDERDKTKDQNFEAAAAAVANALTHTITGAVTHAMAEIEAAEHRGSISGQEMLFAHIVDDLNDLEALRGGDDVEWTPDDLDDYKDKHDIPDF